MKMRKIAAVLLLSAGGAATAGAVVTQTGSFPGLFSGTTVYFTIDLPDGYQSGASYPVIYWTHGKGGLHSVRQGGQPQAYLAAAVAAGESEEAILVYADGNGDWNGDGQSTNADAGASTELSLWGDRYDDTRRIETSVIRDLIAHVEANYPAKKGKANRVVMGFSMGG